MPTGLTYLRLESLSGLTPITTFGTINACTSVTYQNSLTQEQVDAALWALYQAATTRTATGGTISIATTNAAPSGTYQAAAACPVTSSTPGKEIAHELVNDGCGAIANHWATVTITA